MLAKAGDVFSRNIFYGIEILPDNSFTRKQKLKNLYMRVIICNRNAVPDWMASHEYSHYMYRKRERNEVLKLAVKRFKAPHRRTGPIHKVSKLA